MSTASASTDTSCKALHADMKNKPATNKPWCVSGSGPNDNTNSETIMPVCATRIHGRRRPIDGTPKRSITGPANHLNAHGNVAYLSRSPMSPGDCPSLASTALSVMNMNPYGRPWVR